MLLTELAERLAGVEVRVDNLENWLELHEKKQNDSLKEIHQQLKEINDKLSGRPSWPVSIIITVLSSLCAGLLTYLIR